MFGEWMGDDKIILKDSSCKCCEEIEFWKENIDNRQQMKSRIIIKSSRSEITTEIFDLEYCPSCGKKIGGERKWIN